MRERLKGGCTPRKRLLRRMAIPATIVVCRHISLVRKVSNELVRVRLLEISGQRVVINPTKFTPWPDRGTARREVTFR